MNHFLYEIDERKLKLMFHEMEEPLPDGAWEGFLASSGSEATEHKLQLPDFNLNRTVVLAVGFVMLAGLMALGIYKIIHIEPAGTSTLVNEDSSVVEQPQQPVVTKDTIALRTSSPATIAAQAVSKEAAPASTVTVIPTPKEDPKKEAARSAPAAITPPPSEKKEASTEKESITHQKDSVPVKKKKSKKRVEKTSDEPEVLQDIRPLPPPPAEEQEIKIN